MILEEVSEHREAELESTPSHPDEKHVKDELRFALGVLAAFNVAVVANDLAAGRWLSVTILLVAPGVLLMSGSGLPRAGDGVVRLAQSVAASLVILMGLGLAASAVLPILGVDRPLDRIPGVLAADALLVTLGAWSLRRSRPTDWLLGASGPRFADVMTVTALGALPLLAVGGANSLDSKAGGGLALLAVLGAVGAATALLARSDHWQPWVVSAVLASVALTLVLGFSLRGASVFGFDIQQELGVFHDTWNAGAWHVPADGDPYGSMLSITALPALVVGVTGLSGVTVFAVGVAVVLSLVPVLVNAVLREWAPRGAAVSTVLLVLASAAFSQQLPGIARQSVALLLFAEFVHLAGQVYRKDVDAGTVRRLRVAIVALGAGIAVAHYSSAYVAVGLALGTWLITATVGRGRTAPGAVRAFTLPVVALLLAVTVGWNVVLTHSTENVSRLVAATSDRGIDLLPGGRGGSIIGRWLNGNVPQTISGEQYEAQRLADLEEHAPWFLPMRGAGDHRYALVDIDNAGPPPTVWVSLWRTGAVIVAQSVLAAIVAGVALFALRRWRRGRAENLEPVALFAVTLVFVGIVRVSGVAAELYNVERVLVQAAVILGIGLAASIEYCRRRLPRASMLVPVAAVGLLVWSTGLVVQLGTPKSRAPFVASRPVNFANGGEDDDRFVVKPEEVAATTWLSRHVPPDSLVFTDRYGRLRVIGGSSLRYGVVDGLTPATIDRRAFVFLTASNVDGRARGSLGLEQARYVTPRRFLVERKSVVYSNGAVEVLK